MKNNINRRRKYNVARFFGATRNEAEYAKDLGMCKFGNILRFIMVKEYFSSFHNFK